MNMIRALRPKQWIKNSLVFILPFSDGKLIGSNFALINIKFSLIGFVALSLMSSFNYIVNDLRDVEADRQHALKKFRPIANGDLSYIKIASLLSIAIIGAFYTSFSILGVNSTLFLMGFGILQLTYTFALKYIVGFDIVTIAGLFILRVVFPYTYLEIHVSPWLVTTVLFATLSLISGKRHAEILKYQNSGTRKVLSSYSEPILLQLTISFWTLTLYSYVSWLQMQGDRINLGIGIFTIFPLTIIFIRMLPALTSENAEKPEKYIFEDKINLLLILIVGFCYLYGKRFL